MELDYTVKQNDNYKTVKEVIKAYFNISDRLLLKLKNSKKILLNGEPIYVGKEIFTGDTIKILIDFKEDNSNIVPTKMSLNILYEDDYYIVVNKPYGVPVHPSMLHYENSLSNGIKYYFNSIGLQRKIRPVNRLDKDTSGLVIFAKNEYIQNCLAHQMQTHEFEKEYIAVCDGIFEEKQGTINLPIARKDGSIIERCIDKNGDTSITHYEVIKEIDNQISVIRCFLETGRTHQIRVHMAEVGHPLLGDTLYGNTSSLSHNAKRQLLHAIKVSFVHPITMEKVNYEAPITDDILVYYSK